MTILYQVGQYWLFLAQVFKKPDRWSIFWKQLLYEMNALGVGSLGIIAIISLFMGAVISIQTGAGLVDSVVPDYTIGYATRDSVLLEFSPTIIALILAGKIGSNIASQIGTMRVTEQIDALEIMGVNSANFLALPKIMASMLINPFLVAISMFLAIFGGWVAGDVTGLANSPDFIKGLTYEFEPFYITYSMIKTVVFAFIITSISSYFGYYTSGGALEVGQASTKAVVYSSIIVLIANFFLTQLLLI